MLKYRKGWRLRNYCTHPNAATKKQRTLNGATMKKPCLSVCLITVLVSIAYVNYRAFVVARKVSFGSTWWQSSGKQVDASEVLRIIERSRSNTFASTVNRARTDLLQRCPSLLPSAVSKVGVAPGSIDIVITTVNFTTSSDPSSSPSSSTAQV